MKAAFRHIFTLGMKEIIGITRDPLLICLILYSFSISIYLGAFSEPDSITNASIAIVDEDHSPLTKRLEDSFMPPMFRDPVIISADEIDDVMDHGKYTFVVVFPPNFQEKVLANNRPEIQVNVDATRMSQAFIGNGYIQQILVREIARFVRENSPDNGTFYTAEPIIRSRFNPNMTKSWNGTINELVNNIFMIAMVLTGAALIRERERGTLEHLLVTPVNPSEIMISKVWSMSVIVFLATMISLFLVISTLMNIPIAGSVILFFLGVIIGLFSVTSLGMFIACFAKNMPQLGLLMILVLLPMEILSGGTTSQANMPLMIRLVMKFAPTTYFVEFSQAVIFRGAGITLIWPTLLQSFLLGCLYFVIALKKFRQTVAS